MIADDHALVLDALRLLLTSRSSADIVCTATDGAVAMECIRSLHPDIALIDINMPHLIGTEILRAVEAEGLGTRVILMTASASNAELTAAVTAGAWGIVLKRSAAQVLIDCIEKVASGERCLAPAFVTDDNGYHDEGWEKLTARELGISRLVAEGLPNKAIARRLHITPGTVKSHLENIYHKLSVANRTALATRAHRHFQENKSDRS